MWLEVRCILTYTRSEDYSDSLVLDQNLCDNLCFHYVLMMSLIRLEDSYIRKIQHLYGAVEENCEESQDPYQIEDRHWIDDVSKWPPVDYPSIHMEK